MVLLSLCHLFFPDLIYDRPKNPEHEEDRHDNGDQLCDREREPNQLQPPRPRQQPRHRQQHHQLSGHRHNEAVKGVGGTLIITADHGNADEIWDENHKPFSAHTTSPEPFLITNERITLRKTGNLGDIAPTMLELLEIEKPIQMTGKSMILKK